MKIWALADLHLSFGVPNKKMDVFGDIWKDHPQKIEKNWREIVSSEDLVLLPGDFSWAMNLEQVKPDFAWLEQLPGTKVLIKGNHDYWWDSITKVRSILPSSCHVIQNDAFNWKDVSIAGARLWDTEEFDFVPYVAVKGELAPQEESKEEQEKIFLRELQRFEMSLKALRSDAKLKIAMTHYPPISADLKDSRASRLMEQYGINICVFGHLHSLKPNLKMFGDHQRIRYVLTACDAVNFEPVRIY